jgi:hypothetical protein
MRALHRVLMDRPLREKMKERSYRQVTKFSWEKSVRRIMQVYQEVVSTKGKGESPGQSASMGTKTTVGVS